MSRVTLPFDLPLERLRVTAWPDAVVDAVGHDTRSPYVERFWLPLLGPSTLLLARRLGAELDRHPDGFDLDLEATAHSLGLGLRAGTRGPFFRALARTAQFDLTRSVGPAALAARTRLGTLTEHQVRRLPTHLQAEHAEWTASARREPDETQRRRRARRLALSLLELGETTEAAELQLHRWRVHPALAHDALRWATARLAERPPAPASSEVA